MAVHLQSLISARSSEPCVEGVRASGSSLSRASGLVPTEPVATGPVSSARGPTYVGRTLPPESVAGEPSSQLLHHRLLGVLRHPPFKLADWHEALAAATDQAEMRGHVLIEVVGADGDRRCGLGRS